MRRFGGLDKPIVIFWIFFVGKGDGFWNVTERVAAEDVAVGFRADAIIAVIRAGGGDLVEKRRVVDGVVYVIVDVEYVI